MKTTKDTDGATHNCHHTSVKHSRPRCRIELQNLVRKKKTKKTQGQKILFYHSTLQDEQMNL